jgi:hypothetical protein
MASFVIAKGVVALLSLTARAEPFGRADHYTPALSLKERFGDCPRSGMKCSSPENRIVL